jgi:hypothetical protein
MLKTFVLFALTYLCFSCNFNVAGDCKNHIYGEIENQARTFKIMKFGRGCGATTGNSIQLSIIRHNESLLNEAGNTFISNSKVGMYIKRDTSVQPSWINDSTVLIRLDSDLEVFKKDSMVGKVRVIYSIKH